MRVARVGSKRIMLRASIAGAAAAVLIVGSGSARPVPVAPAPCPAHAATTLRAPGWPAARSTLAPPGVVAIRLCRYSGLNARPRLALTRGRLFTGAARVTGLVRNLDRLPAFGPGAVACPNDDGSEILAILVYPSGRGQRISVGLGGCSAVTNGIVVRTAEGFGVPRAYGPQLLAELVRLTG